MTAYVRGIVCIEILSMPSRMGIKMWEVGFLGFFCRKWTNLIGSYGFIHYVHVDDSTNIARIAAEHRWKCEFEIISALGLALFDCTDATGMYKIIL
jgi:hypothetical protein